MYYLTENEIEMNGRTLTQIKKVIDGQEIYGGYIDKMLVHHPNVWVAPNSFLINTEVRGRLIVDKNTTIRNCIIVGSCYVKSGCKLDSSYIMAPPNKSNSFDNNTVLTNQVIKGIGSYDNRFCNDGEILNDNFNGVYLNCTDHYCKVGCLTLSYQRAAEILYNEELLAEFKQRNQQEPNIFTKDTLMWLDYWLQKQLKKVEQ